MNKSFGAPVVTEVDDKQSTITQEVALGNVELPIEQARKLGLVGSRTIFMRAKLEEGAVLPGLRIAYKESLTQGKRLTLNTESDRGWLGKFTAEGLPVHSRMVLVEETEADVRIAGTWLPIDAPVQAEVAVAEAIAQ